MQQPTLTSYFKTKKRPLQSPEERLKAKKQLAAETNNRVQFLKKGNLSPVKKSPVKTKNQDKVDLARLKAVARNFKDSQSKLDKLRQQRKLLDEEQERIKQQKQQKESPKKRLFQADDETPVLSSTTTSSSSSSTEQPTSVPPSIKASPTLTLPLKFQVLKLLNDAMNNISSLFQRRSEVVTFKKLKPAVESTTNHTFSLKSVARMLTMTDYFKVVVQKVDKVNQYVFEFQIELLPSQLVRLKKNFEGKLIEFCLVEHDKFLKSLNIEVDPKLVTRWHPSFNIDAVQIPPTELPEIVEKVSSVTEVLSQVRELVHGNKTPTTSSPVKQQKPPHNLKELKGISASLLAKVREREKNRIVRDLTIPLEQVHIQKIKGRLPEMTRIIHNIFIGEKKTAIEVPLFIERLQFSYRKLSQMETEAHLEYLLKNYPDWIQKIKCTSADYIKINKTVKISGLEF